eukprot:TRINITY_DN50530_c0_g1_i1.p1 TRINITY_DN50530_c0_g1~~TRINITY_DN50530_c0_g1_i1.p1  ORF type:complete len:308 (-),score=31.96 TRINITY_DN50530_c0_g1_i1:47-835(-)
MEEVYESIADVLVRRSSPLHCARFFYVLATSSKYDSTKGGTYSYDEALLRRTAWKLMPPTAFLLDPPLPQLSKDRSFFSPNCLFHCVHMFDKMRLCLELVWQHERDTGHHFDWIVRSRPDLLWKSETELPALHLLPSTGIYVSDCTAFQEKDYICKDPVQIVPRRFSKHVFHDVLDKCLHRLEMGGGIWNCDAWLASYCKLHGVPIHELPLRAIIRRLPHTTDNFHDYNEQWTQHITYIKYSLPGRVSLMGHDFTDHESHWM